MEDKNVTGVIDDLNTPSITKEDPIMFSIKNIFKPSSKSIIIIGMTMKIIGIGIVTLSTIVLPLAALATTATLLIIKYGVLMNIFGIVLGGVGEALILFTKEEPLSTLLRAAEDVQLTAVETAAVQQVEPTQSHILD